MALIEIDRVRREYGSEDALVVAIDEVSMTVEAGEYAAIMGPSGSGKTTLLSILGAMNPPSSGTLRIDGIDVYALTQERQADLRREYIGFVFQQLELVPYLTALENVMLPLAIFKERESESGRSRLSSGWGWMSARPVACLRSCPEESRGGWPSPGPW